MKTVVLFYPSTRFGGSVQVRVELPQALLAIGTPLDLAGYDVKIIDQRVDRDWRTSLSGALDGAPVCVGISAMTGPQIKHGLDASRLVRAHGDTPVVWGGIHPTLLPQQTVEDANVDIVVQGEGEETFPELVRALETGAPLSGVKGIWFKEEGKVRHAGARPLIDLNAQPPHSYHLLNLRSYRVELLGRGHFSIETSRGCPFRCSYCYNTAVFKGAWRALSAEEVVRRVRILVERYGAKGILFTDDNFFGDRKRALDILGRIGDQGWDLILSKVDGHLSILSKLSDEELGIVRRSGCRALQMGIETGSPRIQRLLNKNMPIPDLLDFNRRLRGSGISPHYFFMMGYPTETVEDLKATIALYRRLTAENLEGVPRLNIFTPFPGTGIYEECLRHGFQPPATLEGWVPLNWRTVHEKANWLSHRQKRVIRMLHFTSLLAERNNFINPYKKTPLWVRALAALCLPLARFRMTHLWFGLPLELKAAEWLGLYPRQTCGRLRPAKTASPTA